MDVSLHFHSHTSLILALILFFFLSCCLLVVFWWWRRVCTITHGNADAPCEHGENIFFPFCSGRLGEEGIVPHSVVGPLRFLVFLFVCVRARPRNRATADWKAVLATASRFVEGNRTPDVGKSRHKPPSHAPLVPVSSHVLVSSYTSFSSCHSLTIARVGSSASA